MPKFSKQQHKNSRLWRKSIYDYLKGIGEMPSGWGDTGGFEALKAQVVAAASFAYAYTGGGNNEICTTQDCQVYIGSNKGGKWEEAVNDVKINVVIIYRLWSPMIREKLSKHGMHQPTEDMSGHRVKFGVHKTVDQTHARYHVRRQQFFGVK